MSESRRVKHLALIHTQAIGLLTLAGSVAALGQASIPSDQHTTTSRPQEIITVRPPTERVTRQALPAFIGISQATAGSMAISMNVVRIPPGAAAKPHYHRNHESAIYLLQGQVETRYGEGLCKSVLNRAGDFIFIPPNVPHQPRNLSKDTPAIAIVSRSDPNEQENVVPYQADRATCAKQTTK